VIGATILTKNYAEIGIAAVERFKKRTGLDVIVLWKDKDAFEAKLDLPFLLAPQTVVYFDADHWMIRDCDLSQFNNSPYFWAVKDPGINDLPATLINAGGEPAVMSGSFPVPDATLLGFDPQQYFNGGLWIANFKREDHVSAFAIAKQLYEEKKNGLWKDYQDYGEQGFLNAGIHRAGVALDFLPQTYNFWLLSFKGGLVKSIPHGVIGLHAAGYGLPDKMPHLLQMEQVLECWMKEPRPNAL